MKTKINHHHPFHLVDPSPWPIVASIGALSLTFGGAMFMHNYSNGTYLLILGIITILYVMITWWRDIIREASFEGQHTFAVQKGLRLGMILFIVSEIMFFFAFFWAFFTSSLAPVFNIGGIWPPSNIVVISPWGVPLLNTIILLSSGATVTWAHHAIVGGLKNEAQMSLYLTITLAIYFTAFQMLEYIEAPFSISDGIYGSTFFMTTGFHGFHVLIGTIFLCVCCVRLYFDHFSRNHHFGFEAAIWYWHFVDVVWLFLFLGIYWWGA
uniref:cytochrome oxidase subunit III n=1 Tax=Dictyotopsis propagulifera TaxID=670095 RepID=UPI002E783CD8|nr:cytochrome oxidase subunit III [Dictyotopsis propagulifera]WBP69957.1 cytochrome oxidase subunit III [Dictyotopsis propagulifera]